MIPFSLTKLFPRLNPYTADVIGPVSIRYNCIAHTIGSRHFHIWPTDNRPYDESIPESPVFWPTELPKNESLSNFLKMYELFGYERCDDDSYSEKYRKIAIFCKKGTNIVTHGALQYSQNIWTSKLGDGPVISHRLYELEGNMYGEVRCFVRRLRTITKEFDFEVLGRYLK